MLKIGMLTLPTDHRVQTNNDWKLFKSFSSIKLLLSLIFKFILFNEGFYLIN